MYIGGGNSATTNLRAETLDFGGFDSSRILILRGGIPRPIESIPESLSQAILVGIILVLERLGVPDCGAASRHGHEMVR